MNGPFEISEETQVAMAKYNAQVIDMVADLFVRPGMPQPRRDPATSDEDRDGEYRAQEIFYAALARFRSEVRLALPLTDLRQEALGDLLAGLDDLRPDRGAWDEAINAAKRGW